MNIIEVRKPYHGVNGILTNYHLIYDTYLGIGRCSTIRIPYDCIVFRNIIDLTWDQYLEPRDHQRHSSVTKWTFYPILGGRWLGNTRFYQQRQRWIIIWISIQNCNIWLGK